MKQFILKLAYASGALGMYHRFRNRNALTVIALHRVLATSDPRWLTCDPLYTLSDRLFEQCLCFLSRHYSIVSLAEMERARQSNTALPPRPLLLTFDDGWADNHQYVLPALQRRGLPAVLFVATDVLDRREAFFQEQLIGAWRSGRLDDDALRTLWQQLAVRGEVPAIFREEQVRSLIARLQTLCVHQREQVLASVASAFVDEMRQMLTVAELRELGASGITIGTHGKTHEALTTVANVGRELRDSKGIIAAALQVPVSEIASLSFPFSKHSAAIVDEARQAGYRLQFGGGLTLTPWRGPLPDLFARVGISGPDVTDTHGNLRPDALAAYLFRRPHRTLAAG